MIPIFIFLDKGDIPDIPPDPKGFKRMLIRVLIIMIILTPLTYWILGSWRGYDSFGLKFVSLLISFFIANMVNLIISTVFNL